MAISVRNGEIMGYIRHDAIIVVFVDYEGRLKTFNDFFERAKKLAVEDDEIAATCLIPPTRVMNYYYTCAVLPDGSNKGWETAKIFEKIRNNLKSLCASLEVDYKEIVVDQEEK